MKQNHLQTSLSEDRKEKNDNLHSQHFSSFLPRSGIGTWVRFCLFLFSSRKIISVGRTEAASMLAARSRVMEAVGWSAAGFKIGFAFAFLPPFPSSAAPYVIPSSRPSSSFLLLSFCAQILQGWAERLYPACKNYGENLCLSACRRYKESNF